MFRYKGYVGSAEVSIEDMCLYGKLLGIRDLVLYRGDTVAELGEAFQEAYALLSKSMGLSREQLKDRLVKSIPAHEFTQALIKALKTAEL